MHISKVFYIFALVNQLKLKGDYIMKVSIAVITSDADGCIEVTTKPFSTFEKATKYLMQQYKEIKDKRKEALAKDGEMAVLNIVFKVLRRSGHMGRLIKLRSEIYDKVMSI